MRQAMIGNWYKLMTQSHIDIKLNTSRDVETRILERPGLWMETDELANLRTDLTTIANTTLSKDHLDYGVFSNKSDALNRSIVTIVYEKKSKKPIAFNALALIDFELGDKPINVLHLGLVMIDPEARSKGLSWVLYGLTCVFLFLRNQLRPIWVSNVTQVPAVVGMVGDTFSETFPKPKSGNRRTLTHLLIARQILSDHRHVFGVGKEAEFDEERFIIKNAYTGGSDNLKKSFAQATKHRSEKYNDFCEQELNYERGDDVIQLGKIDLNATRRFLTNDVPRGSLLGLTVAGLWLLLNRLALPVLYWSDSNREWNSLRPHKDD
jgi:hypothetical protein